MGIYFSVATENSDIVSLDVACFDEHEKESFADYETRASAFNEAIASGSRSRDCCYFSTSYNIDHPDVVKAIGSMMELLEIGEPHDDNDIYVGAMTAAEMQRRVVRALAKLAVGHYPEMSKEMLAQRLTALAGLCDFGQTHRRAIIWS